MQGDVGPCDSNALCVTNLGKVRALSAAGGFGCIEPATGGLVTPKLRRSQLIACLPGLGEKRVTPQGNWLL